ncbi:MAG: hypothetical protein H0A76_02120 [Candidatus Thiodubiliella endoseptemdiera]|uniref:Uncharacterized protein n=1 Tax=Candidatus Thiodubiliella endoseptemdiera TaxID=2738886 RepID=A0A853EZN7_9GAMM|nr:hypothetical protein [Candidatus Thiodubiliella endoseptemdiera]
MAIKNGADLVLVITGVNANKAYTFNCCCAQYRYSRQSRRSVAADNL